MAHKPDEKFVGAWMNPNEIEKIDALANAMALSRSAVLRQLLDLAAGRVKPKQIAAAATNIQLVEIKT